MPYELNMTIYNETIAAISTPLGEGGIGIVRLSGKDAILIADKLFSSPKNKKLADLGTHRLVYGFIKDPSTDKKIDEVLVAVMRAPHTYTREDIVEINCHGGILPLRKTLELVLNHGAMFAEPGEFTRRAFLNNRLDLSQAEAVIDLIRAKTEEAGRVALEQLSGGLSEKITSLRERITGLCAHIEAYIDFPEEDIDLESREGIAAGIRSVNAELTALSNSFENGRFFREGLKAAIVGRPNVGKSSLLNALLDTDRAIVTEMPGTTRDVLEEYLNIKGLPVRIMDTAGIRETHDLAEKEGVKRSLRAIENADIVIAVIDGTVPLNDQDIEVLDRLKGKKSIIAINKSDLSASATGIEEKVTAYTGSIIKISAKSGLGLDELKEKIVDISLSGTRAPERAVFGETEGVIITNVRHRIAIDHALGALKRSLEGLDQKQPLEIVAIEMREALDSLGEIAGAVATEDILDRIFSDFCIGK